MDMDVSVCIVNWNTRELLRRCLQSIREHTTELRLEVIVVDNASADSSAAMVATDFPEVKLLASKENLGFGRGSNRAAASALGRFVLYLNPDTELVNDAIFGMWLHLVNNPGTGAVGCRLLNSDGSVQFTCASSFPTPRNELTSLLFLDRLFPRSSAFSSRELGYWNHSDSREVECLSGACMMMPRALALRLGGFDESLFMYGEDLDICCRVRAEGLRVHYLASETIYHHEGAASRRRGRSFAPLLQRSANYYFLRKNFGPMAAIGYRGAVSIGSAARIVAAMIALPWWLLARGVAKHELWDFIARHADLLFWSIGLRRALKG
jgi:GT2 family glycosyltransferase